MASIGAREKMTMTSSICVMLLIEQGRHSQRIGAAEGGRGIEAAVWLPAQGGQGGFPGADEGSGHRASPRPGSPT
jgi:hypothetical protein